MCGSQARQLNKKGERIKTAVKRTLMVSGALLSVGAATVGSIGLASAATGSTGQDSLVDKLVTKFNLNKEEVQQVFDEERTAREAEHQQKLEERIDTLVSDGKLTQEQADKLLAKIKEVQANRAADRDNMQDKTHEERKAAMEEQRDSLKQWLSDNGIAEEYGRLLMGGGRGPGGPGGPPPAEQEAN